MPTPGEVAFVTLVPGKDIKDKGERLRATQKKTTGGTPNEIGVQTGVVALPTIAEEQSQLEKARQVQQATKGLIAVSESYAQQNRIGTVKIGDYYYRPAISSSENKRINRLGITREEYMLQKLASMGYKKAPETMLPGSPGEVARRTQTTPMPAGTAREQAIGVEKRKQELKLAPVLEAREAEWRKWATAEQTARMNFDERLKWEAELKEANPSLYNIYKTGGVSAYNQAVMFSDKSYTMQKIAEAKTKQERQLALDNLIVYLDNVASQAFFKNGGNSKERIALDNAIRMAGFKLPSGSGAIEWRKMTNDQKAKVIESYIAPTGFFGIEGAGGVLAFELNKLRNKLSDWIEKEKKPPQDISVTYLDKIADYNFFASGGTVKERMALVNAMKQAGFSPDVNAYRSLSNSDKNKVVGAMLFEPALSKEIETKIDKPVGEFFENLQTKSFSVKNPILRALASGGTGIATTIGGGTAAFGTSIIKSISDLAEGYDKHAVAQAVSVPLGMAEFITVATPQYIMDDPISGIPFTVGAFAAPFVPKGLKIAGKGAFKAIREIVPSKFEFSNLALETSIPRTQVRGNMTAYDAVTLIGDVERVWSGKVPEYLKPALKSDPVVAAIFSSMVKGVDIAIKDSRGKVLGRVNPSQMGLENVLYSVKPDIMTYAKRLAETGKDITPAGSMEWWSPNFSADVMGWYLGKVDKYSPGGKMLRYTANDIKAYPKSVFEKVFKMSQKEWDKIKKAVGGDRVSAFNEALKIEVIRRAQLPSGHPEALPPGIYPVFKFHWSYEPSGIKRPTFELEMVTPAGFETSALKPTTWSSKLKIGEGKMPELATIDTYSPIQGFDKVSGQGVKLGQKVPVIITATDSALAVGKGVPTLGEMYAIKFLYKPVVAVKNIFAGGKEIRPRATEYQVISTPRKWYSRAIKLKGAKEAATDIQARQVLTTLKDADKLSTPELAAKLGETVVNGRITRTRDAYYHPVFEYADNWVTPRVAAMLKNPNWKGSYIVFNDTAEVPNVWNMGGGQIDPKGTPRIRRSGSITLEESLREQVISEIGVDLKDIRPAKIHEGKTTEHSSYGTYMFDAEPTSMNFKITPGEVRAIRILYPGDTAAVTPALYIELAKRGFDVSNLYVWDKSLPTAGIKQYRTSFEANLLSKAKKLNDPSKIPVKVNKAAKKYEQELFSIDKQLQKVENEIQKTTDKNRLAKLNIKHDKLLNELNATRDKMTLKRFERDSPILYEDKTLPKVKWELPKEREYLLPYRPEVERMPALFTIRPETYPFVSRIKDENIAPTEAAERIAPRITIKEFTPANYEKLTREMPAMTELRTIPRITPENETRTMPRTIPERLTETTPRTTPEKIPETTEEVTTPTTTNDITGKDEPALLLPKKAETKGTGKGYDGAVAWAQGQLIRKDGKLITGYRIWKYPYRQEDLEWKPETDLPEGIQVVKGIAEAGKTIQQFRGNISPGEAQQADIGAFVARVERPTDKPGSGQIRFTRDTNPESWKKLVMHTTLDQLIQIVFKPSSATTTPNIMKAMGMSAKVAEKADLTAKQRFAKSRLAEKLEDTSHSQIVSAIEKNNLSSSEKKELLKMLPDRSRSQVEVLMSNPTLYAPTRGTPKAEYSLLKRKKGKNKARVMTPELRSVRA